MLGRQAGDRCVISLVVPPGRGRSSPQAAAGQPAPVSLARPMSTPALGCSGILQFDAGPGVFGELSLVDCGLCRQGESSSSEEACHRQCQLQDSCESSTCRGSGPAPPAAAPAAQVLTSRVRFTASAPSLLNHRLGGALRRSRNRLVGLGFPVGHCWCDRAVGKLEAFNFSCADVGHFFRHGSSLVEGPRAAAHLRF